MAICTACPERKARFVRHCWKCGGHLSPQYTGVMCKRDCLEGGWHEPGTVAGMQQHHNMIYEHLTTDPQAWQGRQ